MILNVTSSGNFRERLNKRRASWAGNPLNLTIKGDGDPRLKFWYWQEFGATPTASGTIEPTTSPHLVFEGILGHIMANSVISKGVRAQRYIQQALPDIHKYLQDMSIQSLKSGGADNPHKFQEDMFAAMEHVKKIIMDAMDQVMPGSRPEDPEFPNQGGKLKGQTASQFFDEHTSIVKA